MKPGARAASLVSAGSRVLAVLLGLACARTCLAAAPQGESVPAAFPPPRSAYGAEDGLSLRDVLLHRVRSEPLNAVATGLFLLAILHTFAAPGLMALAHRKKRECEEAVARDIPGDDIEPPDPYSFRLEVLHLLGEIEAVFGIWAVPLLVTIAVAKGWHAAEGFLSDRVNFTEPIFVVVVMALASTRPIMRFAEGAIGMLARLGGNAPWAWWLSVLTVGPILGSFITEPAAMMISALLLSRYVFELGPTARLKYATLGLLFVNISVGGTFTHFAAPPVVMVAAKWGWDTPFMASHLGWKALTAILVSNGLYWAWLRQDLALLRRRSPVEAAPAERGVPTWVTVVTLLFLAFTVLTAHTPALFVGGFLFFLAFAEASAPHQHELNLRGPLLVGFFLAGLVIHGSLQEWWIGPVLGRLDRWPLMLGATFLTAFNDNAAITYLASLVPGFTDELKYAVMAGAVTGGGLTVIANAPNPAGQSVLARHFEGGISAAGLLLGALLPTIVAGACFMFLPH